MHSHIIIQLALFDNASVFYKASHDVIEFVIAYSVFKKQLVAEAGCGLLKMMGFGPTLNDGVYSKRLKMMEFPSGHFGKTY